MSTQRTEITREVLERWLWHYLPEKIDEFSAITIGVSNTTYAVRCASGRRYVVRKLETQASASVEVEALIQQALLAHGLCSPAYLALRDGQFVGHDDGDMFTIAHQLQGEHPEQLSLELARSCGEVLATIHDALRPEVIRLPYNRGQWLNRHNVSLEIARCNPNERAVLEAVLADAMPLFDDGLPLAIIHGELATNNLFASGELVTTVFDFENAEHAPRLLDLAYTFVSMVYDDQLDPSELIVAICEGYDSVARQPLTTPEVAQFTRAVQYTAVAASAWCHARDMSVYGIRFLTAGTQPATLTAARKLNSSHPGA